MKNAAITRVRRVQEKFNNLQARGGAWVEHSGGRASFINSAAENSYFVYICSVGSSKAHSLGIRFFLLYFHMGSLCDMFHSFY